MSSARLIADIGNADNHLVNAGRHIFGNIIAVRTAKAVTSSYFVAVYIKSAYSGALKRKNRPASCRIFANGDIAPEKSISRKRVDIRQISFFLVFANRRFFCVRKRIGQNNTVAVVIGQSVLRLFTEKQLPFSAYINCFYHYVYLSYYFVLFKSYIITDKKSRKKSFLKRRFVLLLLLLQGKRCFFLTIRHN